MKYFNSFLIICLSLASAHEAFGAEKKIRIGLSMDTLKEERWQRDRELFVKRATELGAEVLVQAANGNDSLQNTQAENLLTQGIDVLVVVPHNGVSASSIVKLAHKAGKKVISYDRLIKNSDVDVYISFDNLGVGKLQAEYLVNKMPKGNYLLIGGSPTDNNAKLIREGQMQALATSIKSGNIKVVANPWANEWQATEALKHTENNLTKSNNNIQAIIASNDGTAGGVIAALKQQKLDGKVLVSGQDADLTACQRVVDGTQTMTVYKPIKDIAYKAAEIAVALAKKEKITTTDKVNNGKIDVPSILLKPIAVDKSNMMQTVVKDGFHSEKDVYKNNLKAKR